MHHLRKTAVIIGFTGLFGAAAALAQGINQWQGSEDNADWNDPYKWKLQHVPSSDETVHFRQEQSVITINSTIELDNGMMLYGQNLFLQGHGNINLLNPVPHRHTVNIPASATGFANLTLSDTLSLNGRISLAAKAFGTSSSKGSVTLKDRSNIMGVLSIGNSGSGTGQIFIKDQATFRISGLELNTRAEMGGLAEIHILGGTASLESTANAFEIFLEDPSRKIILGERGKLIINSQLPADQKRMAIAEMINQHRIVATTDCRLTPPAIHNNMVIVSAVFGDKPPSGPGVEEPLEASVEPWVNDDGQPSDKLESILQHMETIKRQEAEKAMVTEETTVAASEPSVQKTSSPPLKGYIVFVSAILFLIRPNKGK